MTVKSSSIIKYSRQDILEILRKHAQYYFGAGGVKFDCVEMMEETAGEQQKMYNDSIYVQVIGTIPDVKLDPDAGRRGARAHKFA